MGNTKLCGPQGHQIQRNGKIIETLKIHDILVKVQLGELQNECEDFSLIVNYSSSPEESNIVKRGNDPEIRKQLKEFKVKISQCFLQNVEEGKNVMHIKIPQYHTLSDLSEIFPIFTNSFKLINDEKMKKIIIVDNLNAPFCMPKQLSAELLFRTIFQYSYKAKHNNICEILFLSQNYQNTQIYQYELLKIKDILNDDVTMFQNNQKYLKYLEQNNNNQDENPGVVQYSMTISKAALTQQEIQGVVQLKQKIGYQSIE